MQKQPKKLQKPARPELDLRKEELVTYANEAGAVEPSCNEWGTCMAP